MIVGEGGDDAGAELVRVRVGQLQGGSIVIVTDLDQQLPPIWRSRQIPPLHERPHISYEHPIIRRLKTEQAGPRFDDWARILFDQALLSEGGKLEDPAGFVHRLNEMFLMMSEGRA